MSSRVRLLTLSVLLVGALLALALTTARGGGVRALARALTAPAAPAAVATTGAVRANLCPICGRQSVFLPTGQPPRPFAKCGVCGSLERHRLLYLFLRERTNLFRDELSVLHFSPERGLSQVLRAQKNLTYATSWYEPERPADYHLDLTRLDLPDASWDVMIVYHVFEHIPDDRAGMREMLRVLKPGGWAVVQVPVRGEEPTTLEDPSVQTAEERNRVFGQEDHVRYYGWKDFGDRLAEAGFEVSIERFARELSPEQRRAFAVDADERIYLVRKPATVAAAPAAGG